MIADLEQRRQTAEAGEEPKVAPEAPDPADQINGMSDMPGARMLFYTRERESVSLDGWYKGRSCFLVCGGPSLKDLNLGLLNTPGVVTWGMNNSWSVVRPRLWTCVDPAGKFALEGWLDPGITKVVPAPLSLHRLRYWTGTEFKDSRLRVRDCPAVWFWQRNSRFEPADFLTEPSVCWGNDPGQSDALGVDGIRCVMLATVRLVHALGFRTLYLLGADFRMENGRQNYAFPQGRAPGAVAHNNALFAAMNRRFEALAPYFDLDGFRVFNCTPGSGLTAFPFKRLSEAVAEATREVARPMRTEGMYDHQPTAAEVREGVRHLWDHGD